MHDNEKLFYQSLMLLQQRYPEQYKMSGFCDILESADGEYGIIVPKLQKDEKKDDGNANTRDRYIGILLEEFNNPVKKIENYRILFNKICDIYGKSDAFAFLQDDIIGTLYVHNSTNISSKPYCFAYDFKRLAEEGAFFTDIADKPAQHLDSFIQHVIEFVAVTCRETTGAVGMPALLPYMWYFWNKDKENNYSNDPDRYLKQQIQMLIYKLNGSEMRINESAFTNISVMDESYLEKFFGDRLFPDREPVIYHIDDIVEFGKTYLRHTNDILRGKVMTFPVVTDCLLYDDENKKFVNEETARDYSKINMRWNNANIYCSTDISAISSCCRVVSNVDTIKEKLKGFSNFIGGSDLDVGSVGVITVNIPHHAYVADGNIDIFRKSMEISVQRICKYLHCIREVIKDLISINALKIYHLKMVELARQFNTAGFIGLYDAAKILGVIDILAFETEILGIFNTITSEFSEDKDYSINIEQIPGESACVKLAKKDKITFGESAVSTNCYSNQWVPLSEDCSIFERAKYASVLDKLCGGGSILHINIDAPLQNEEQDWQLLNDLAEMGVIYHGKNCKIDVCELEHGFHGDTCWCGRPKCGVATRPVGFITLVKNWIPSRQEEFKTRKWAKSSDI